MTQSHVATVRDKGTLKLESRYVCHHRSGKCHLEISELNLMPYEVLFWPYKCQLKIKILGKGKYIHIWMVLFGHLLSLHSDLLKWVDLSQMKNTWYVTICQAFEEKREGIQVPPVSV